MGDTYTGPFISAVKLPGSNNTYYIKDEAARAAASAGMVYYIAWAGTAAPVVADIPEGVVINYNGTSYTGEKTATSASPGIYLVKSQTQAGTTLDAFDEYIIVTSGTGKSWEKLGDTQIDLSDIVTEVTLTKQTDVVLGEATTFTNASSSVSFSGGANDKVLGEATTFALTSGTVTHGSLSGHTDTVLGTGSTFTVTNPTVTVTPSTTYIKANASTAAGARTQLGLTSVTASSWITVDSSDSTKLNINIPESVVKLS